MCSLGQWNITFPLLFHETVKHKLRPVVTERGERHVSRRMRTHEFFHSGGFYQLLCSTLPINRLRLLLRFAKNREEAAFQSISELFH